MSYRDGMDALLLRMPKKIPRTEYSTGMHYPLLTAVTGMPVSADSDSETKRRAVQAFEKAWNFGLTWCTNINGAIFGDFRTDMGHANYAINGSDFRKAGREVFASSEEVYAFSPFEQFGAPDRTVLTENFNRMYAARCDEHPDQVNMAGIYVTLMSGLIDLMGWNSLLLAAAEDSDEFGAMANRYAMWIQAYFDALAACDAPVVMMHDDIVWTSGAFINPTWYRKYIFPNYERYLEPLHRAGKLILFTSDGTYDEFIDDIAACGVNGFVMEPTVDMAAFAKKYGKTHAFIGNADCRILTFGSREDIRKEVERCVNIGRDCPGYFMAVGNHIPSNVPVENALYYNEIFQSLSER